MKCIVKAQRLSLGKLGVLIASALWMFVILPLSAMAAPYAGFVIDARSGKVLHSENADTRLHPASLTKMMTLYVVFDAVEKGEISLDTKVRISRKAASEPPSKLGLRSGQRIKLRYLIRAAAVKSANDAATALGEAIEGSESAFARRMNRTAKELGMKRTTFKNAHGLTEQGHLSTARDMTTLGRHLFFDFPDYYNLFSRLETHAGIKQVPNTNRRFLSNYKGADGIKTGYTRAAGFNLVASAERNGERIIATVFGGRSTATRNAQVAKLLDLGFRKAPRRVAVIPPKRKTIAPSGASGKTVRLDGAVSASLRPKARPSKNDPAPALLASLDLKDEIASALAEAQTVSASATDITAATNTLAVPVPRPRPTFTAVKQKPARPEEPRVVTRLSQTGQRDWGINIGRFPSRYAAEKMLLKTALAEMATLEQAQRKIDQSTRGFDARFIGLTQETADLACRKLQARSLSCIMVGPSS